MTTTKRSPARRRANGEGAVFYNTATDRWHAVVSVGGGKRRKLTARTRPEVVDKLRALHRQMDDGITVEKAPPTVAELAEEWLAKRAVQRKAASTYSRVEVLVRTNIVPHLGPIRIDALTVADVEDWLGAEADRGMARSTLEGHRKHLGEMLEWARTRLRIIPFNVARVAELPAGAKGPRQRRTLTEGQAADLLKTLRDEDRCGPYFTTILLLGLRPGEADALSWDKVDFEAGTIVIDAALQRASGGRAIAVGATKTNQVRVLAMSEPVAEALRRQRVQQHQDRLAAGSLWSTDWDGLVFLTEIGTPSYPSNVRRSFTRICAAAGVPALIPYELRHSAASLLVAAGLPPFEVADLLGHKDTRMRDRHYRHRLQPVVTAGPGALAALAPAPRRRQHSA